MIRCYDTHSGGYASLAPRATQSSAPLFKNVVHILCTTLCTTWCTTCALLHFRAVEVVHRVVHSSAHFADVHCFEHYLCTTCALPRALLFVHYCVSPPLGRRVSSAQVVHVHYFVHYFLCTTFRNCALLYGIVHYFAQACTTLRKCVLL